MTTLQQDVATYDGFVEIGRGGFATVYRAWQPTFERDVAIKVISGSLDPDAFARFQRECVAIGALSGHPNIVTVYDVDASDRARPSIVMELLDGGSLAEQVLAEGPLPWAEVVSIGVKLAGALESAHRASVLHLDIKPENVLVSRFGEPKLTDFGIARVQGAGDTGSGMVWATLAHAAPEVVAGGRPNVAADVYSLGSTLHHLLSGQPAFLASGDGGIVPLVVRIARDAPPDLRGRGVPDALCALLERAMAKDPSDRQLSAAQIGRQLQAVEIGAALPITPMPVESDAAPRRVSQGPCVPGAGAPLGPVGTGRPEVTVGRSARREVPGPSGPSEGGIQSPARTRRPWARRTRVLGALLIVLAAVALLLPSGRDPMRLSQIYEDSFDSAVGWHQKDDPAAAFGYQAGRYHVAVREPRRQAVSDAAPHGVPITQLDHVSARVSVTAVSGTGLFGLVCRRVSGGGGFYEGLIGVDGSARIAKFDGARFVPLMRVSGAPRDASRPMRLRFDCIGPPSETRLALFADNQLLTQVVDRSGLVAGGTGVVLASADAAAAEVSFDDFAIVGRSS